MDDGGVAMAAEVPVRRKNPWWIPRFLGRVPADVGPTELSLLAAVSLALTFEEYDLSMLTSALSYIAASLGMQENDLGFYLGLIRLGALPAFLLIPLADKLGRRRIFLVSVGVTGLATFATAFTQTPIQFVVMQMLTRVFVVAGSAVAFVMITEEYPAKNRGWGIGMLGALGVMGHGLSAGLFSLIEVLPFGWRFLYAVGLVPVLLLPWLSKRIPETRRFREHQRETQAGAADHGAVSLRSLVDLFAARPGRATLIAFVAFLPAIGLVSAFQFTGYFTQEVHGWEPGQYSLMVIIGGGFGIGGNVAAGYLGDRFGRRLVGFALFALFPIFVTAFYLGRGWMLPVVWVAFMFCAQGGRMVHRALATELFPTAHRGAASGLFAILTTVGEAAGLFILFARSHKAGDLPHIIPWLAAVVAVGGAAILLFPETKQKELEQID